MGRELGWWGGGLWGGGEGGGGGGGVFSTVPEADLFQKRKAFPDAGWLLGDAKKSRIQGAR